METAFLDKLINYGIGGVFALIMFFIYRQDKQETERSLTKLLDMAVKAMTEQCHATAEMTELLRTLNGRIVELTREQEGHK